MNLSTAAPLTLQVAPVHLLSEQVTAAAASQPWPVGYTMTVWGVAIGITVLIALLVTTSLRLSPHARALTLQAIVWRLSLRQLLALRSVSQASNTPPSVLLISRGAFEAAAAVWVERNGEPSVRARRALASMTTRVYGPQTV